MDTNEARERIAKYLDSDAHTPIIVDVCDSVTWDDLIYFFKVGDKKIIKALDISENDDYIPPIDKILQAVSIQEHPVMLTGLSAYLKLQGEAAIKRQLRSILDLEVKNKLVVLTYKCANYLKFQDPRIIAQKKVLTVSGVESSLDLRSLVFIAPEMQDFFDSKVTGIKCIPNIEPTPQTNLNIITNKSKADYPNSLFDIRDVKSAYDVIISNYESLSNLSKSLGTDGQWQYMLHNLKQYGSWSSVVLRNFGGIDKLSADINALAKESNNKQWLYLIALKLHGAGSNHYLAEISRLATSVDTLKKLAYEHILSFEANDKKFKGLYKERKEILRTIFGDEDNSFLANFIKLAKGKGASAINYMTDLSPKERKEIISIIGEFNDAFDDTTLMSILKVIYPDLHDYLLPYHFDAISNKFEPYFNTYKFCKLRNIISPELYDIVEAQAKKREYNSTFVPRASVVAKLKKERSKVYFIDALGVEFLSYIQQKCFERGLNLNSQLALCNLPSITSQNKEFFDDFAPCNVDICNIKDLDNIKHEGTGDYNYVNNKYPIHLYAELEALDKIINDISVDLDNGVVDTIYIISDHGASRLAVIHETEQLHEVAEKGQHSGRCCPKSELEEKPDCATEENDFWCLANYDRFKGGRKSNVEVHGGASLEEVVVPIITVRKSDTSVDCRIETPEITVSFKDKPALTIFCGIKTDDLSVLYKGNYYQASAMQTAFRYSVVIDAPMAQGEHQLDVYANGGIIAKGLSFTVKKRGSSERKFF